MGKSDETLEIPADKLAENQPPERKLNGLAKRAGSVKAFFDKGAANQAKAEAEFDRKTWNWYRKTWAGKAWVKWRNKARKTKGGRIALVAVYLGMFGLMLAATPLAAQGIGAMFDASVGHINLTAAQTAEGYYEGCSGKYCSNKDGAGYRDLTSSEKANGSCPANAEKCIMVIPLQTECTTVTVMIDEYKHKGDWGPSNTLFLKHYPQVGKNVPRGVPFVFAITGLSVGYAEWSINEVRCDY